MHLLLTGGLGFVGSHVCVAMQQAGHTISIVDNLANSDSAVLEGITKITGIKPYFEKVDVLDTEACIDLCQRQRIEGVVHFAGLKSVVESVAHPKRYQQINVGGAKSLLKVMTQCHIEYLVFSSSATVYGVPQTLPLREQSPLKPINPYATSKLAIEQLIEQHAQNHPEFKAAILRYFNPIGAHPSGVIGEYPRGKPNNIMPMLMQVAAGILPELLIMGDDYDTQDGSGVRDYIHVCDIAEAHQAALSALQHGQQTIAVDKYNIGTGYGISVFELIETFEKTNAVSINTRIGARRAGDVASCYADPSHAQQHLNWKAQLNLKEMCQHSWQWQQQLLKNQKAQSQ